MSSTYPVIKGSLLSSESYTWNTADSVGRGASAVVFLGRHKVRGTVVAVKVFHDHVALGYKQDDLRELELLRCLDHKNIIKLLAIEKEVTNQKTVLVTEYCEGGSLHQMLDQPLYYYGLPENEFKLVLFHVAAGMQYLREKNVIHRDIKPGNIMRSLTQEGFSVYKLTDFGAARNLDEDESFQSLYGTEEYLYPGVYERAVLKLPTAQSFDAKVDLWSLGVTFYHTATGELPFQPYGGRQNKETMFQIITQKQSGVISGVQSSHNGPILWKKDLPETAPISSGLKAEIVPLLARLMEPEPALMISYDNFFSFVDDLREKMTVDVFHFAKCKNLKVYAHPATTLPGLQDLVAGLTDIPAEDQILLVGGRALDEVVDPLSAVRNYPTHLLHDSLYLFQREMADATRLPRPEIPAFPEFTVYSDMDSDARLAHSCATRGELIKRFLNGICEQQQCLMNGLLYFRLYVENRLAATKSSHDFMQQLMNECDLHVKTFFNMSSMMKDVISSINRNHPDIDTLESILKDTVIRQVYKKAAERMEEIKQYRDVLINRLEEVKSLAGRVTAGCREEQCYEKVVHHLSVITGVQSRFRRDKSVKHQMTKHDENIHHFERQKLQMHCATMKSIFTDHCLGQLEKVYRSALQVCESLSRCLTRVMKVEKNINSVLNCQDLLSQKLTKLVGSLNKLKSVEDSGFVDGKSSDGSSGPPRPSSFLPANLTESMMGVSSQTQELSQKLVELQESLDYNSQLLRALDETPLQSSGSLSRRIEAMALNLAETPDVFQQRNLPSSSKFEPTPVRPLYISPQQILSPTSEQHGNAFNLPAEASVLLPPSMVEGSYMTPAMDNKTGEVFSTNDPLAIGITLKAAHKQKSKTPKADSGMYDARTLIPLDSYSNFMVRLPEKGGAKFKTSAMWGGQDPNFYPPKPVNNSSLAVRGHAPNHRAPHSTVGIVMSHGGGHPAAGGQLSNGGEHVKPAGNMHTNSAGFATQAGGVLSNGGGPVRPVLSPHTPSVSQLGFVPVVTSATREVDGLCRLQAEPYDEGDAPHRRTSSGSPIPPSSSSPVEADEWVNANRSNQPEPSHGSSKDVT